MLHENDELWNFATSMVLKSTESYYGLQKFPAEDTKVCLWCSMTIKSRGCTLIFYIAFLNSTALKETDFECFVVFQAIKEGPSLFLGCSMALTS